jgi:hypothetical protein
MRVRIAAFSDSGQQIAREIDLLQLRFNRRNIEVVLARIVPIDCDLIHLGRGSDVPGAYAVVSEPDKEIRRS